MEGKEKERKLDQVDENEDNATTTRNQPYSHGKNLSVKSINPWV